MQKSKIKKSAKNKISKDKEKHLEEEIKEAEKEIPKRIKKIDENKFIEEIEFQESRAPVLEKINPSPVQNLERNLSSVRISVERKNDAFKYSADFTNKEQPKYQNAEHVTDISRSEIGTLGRRENPMREAGFMPSPEAMIAEQKNFEKYESVKGIETENLGREQFQERKEVKYKPIR